MTPRRLCRGRPVVLALLALLALPGVALAAAVPGATYTGTASDGATVTVKVSSSGTSVSAYSVVGIFGKDVNNQICQDTTSVGPTGWPGAPISNDGFHDTVGTEFSISGTFGAGQSASGTFSLNQPAQGGGTGCSTGTISWTATTSSTGKPGGGSGTSGGKPGRKTVAVRMNIRRLAQRKLLGSLKASTASCTARRTVYLWSGRKRLGVGRANAKGAFSFKVRRGWRRRHIHASVKKLVTTARVCTSAESKAVKG